MSIGRIRMDRFFYGENNEGVSNLYGTNVVWCCTNDNKFSCYGYIQKSELTSALVLLLLEVKKMRLVVIDPPQWANGAIKRSTPVPWEVVRNAVAQCL